VTIHFVTWKLIYPCFQREDIILASSSFFPEKGQGGNFYVVAGDFFIFYLRRFNRGFSMFLKLTPRIRADAISRSFGDDDIVDDMRIYDNSRVMIVFSTIVWLNKRQREKKTIWERERERENYIVNRPAVNSMFE